MQQPGKILKISVSRIFLCNFWAANAVESLKLEGEGAASYLQPPEIDYLEQVAPVVKKVFGGPRKKRRDPKKSLQNFRTKLNSPYLSRTSACSIGCHLRKLAPKAFNVKFVRQETKSLIVALQEKLKPFNG